MNTLNYFSVVKRNFGHWDFYSETKGRLFRMRGQPGKWLAMDERERPYPVTEFTSFGMAMGFIVDTLTHESLVPDTAGNNRPMKEDQQ